MQTSNQLSMFYCSCSYTYLKLKWKLTESGSPVFSTLSLCSCWKQRSILIPHHKWVFWIISLSLICLIKQRCLPVTHAKNNKSLAAHHNITLAAEIANICRTLSCSPQGWLEILGLQVQSAMKQPAKQERQTTCQSISRESHVRCSATA